MKLYDITQEVFSGKIYPGDVKPSYDIVSDMEQGETYNLSNISMCVHNGTHIDAPSHFIVGARTIDELDLSKCIGKALVVALEGTIGSKDIRSIMTKGIKRLLFKGNCEISLEAAKEMNHFQIVLVGVESQSVGLEASPMAVHIELLQQEVVLLEGIDLSNVPLGEYTLFAAPLKLGKLEGAPCRAVLIAD